MTSQPIESNNGKQGGSNLVGGEHVDGSSSRIVMLVTLVEKAAAYLE